LPETGGARKLLRLFSEEGTVPLFAILTLFPDAIEPYVRSSILGLAQSKGLLEVLLVDFRDFARDRHRTVDDRPFGGGPGMVLRPEPLVDCIEWLEERHGRFRRLALCPGGSPLRQPLVNELAGEQRVALLCGRYEGFDARIREILKIEEVSVGDFVVAGGELPALLVLEAAARLIPGVLGDERSAQEDSFAQTEGGMELLDCPHYTRPRVYRGLPVPEVLLSGDHRAIAAWRRQQALERTKTIRPDILPDGTTIPDNPATNSGAAPGPAPDSPSKHAP
jgi:tRNA (guanine37-N1)-methyltransferase